MQVIRRFFITVWLCFSTIRKSFYYTPVLLVEESPIFYFCRLILWFVDFHLMRLHNGFSNFPHLLYFFRWILSVQSSSRFQLNWILTSFFRSRLLFFGNQSSTTIQFFENHFLEVQKIECYKSFNFYSAKNSYLEELLAEELYIQKKALSKYSSSKNYSRRISFFFFVKAVFIRYFHYYVLSIRIIYILITIIRHIARL